MALFQEKICILFVLLLALLLQLGSGQTAAIPGDYLVEVPSPCDAACQNEVVTAFQASNGASCNPFGPQIHLTNKILINIVCPATFSTASDTPAVHSSFVQQVVPNERIEMDRRLPILPCVEGDIQANIQHEVKKKQKNIMQHIKSILSEGTQRPFPIQSPCMSESPSTSPTPSPSPSVTPSTSPSPSSSPSPSVTTSTSPSPSKARKVTPSPSPVFAKTIEFEPIDIPTDGSSLQGSVDVEEEDEEAGATVGEVVEIKDFQLVGDFGAIDDSERTISVSTGELFFNVTGRQQLPQSTATYVILNFNGQEIRIEAKVTCAGSFEPIEPPVVITTALVDTGRGRPGIVFNADLKGAYGNGCIPRFRFSVTYTTAVASPLPPPPSPSSSASALPTPSISTTPNPSISESSTPTPSPSVSPSVTPSVTPSLSPSPSPSSSLLPIESEIIAPSVSPTSSPSASRSPSPTASITPSSSATPSLTPSLSVSSSVTPTPSVTPSMTPSASVSSSVTPSPSFSSSVTPSPSVSSSNSATPSVTPSITPSPSFSSSVTPSPSYSSSTSATPSVTPSLSVSPSVTASVTVSPSVTPSASVSATVSPSITISPSPTASRSPAPVPWGVDEVDGTRDGQYGCVSSNRGAGIHVLVVDSGCEPMNGGLCDSWPGYAPAGTCPDGNGHGTHVAGTIGDPIYGVASRAKISCYKVFPSSGGGTTAALYAAFDFARANDVDVINLSLGLPGTYTSTYFDNEVISIANYPKWVVNSAGNDNLDSCNTSPQRAKADTLFKVQAHGSNRQTTYFTNYGTCTDISAPGLSIPSLSHTGNQPSYKSGTSMAAPHVAGMIAQLISDGRPPILYTLTENGYTINTKDGSTIDSLGVNC